jgi:uncharacterized protein YodC (DUF2158 family)
MSDKERIPAFEKGTIVKLKSGGPEMTVRGAVISDRSSKWLGSYDCQWFAGKKLESGRFPEESLEVASPPQKKS